MKTTSIRTVKRSLPVWQRPGTDQVNNAQEGGVGANLSWFGEGGCDDQSFADVHTGPAADPVHPLVMLTTGGSKRPNVGFIVVNTISSSSHCECIRVAVDGGSLLLTAGVINRAHLTRFPVAITARQTSRQPWLQRIWGLASPFTESKELGHQGQDTFTPLHDVDLTDIDPFVKQRLAIMLFWHHWHAGASDDLKIAELKELGLPGASDRGGMWTMISRMKICRCTTPPFSMN